MRINSYHWKFGDGGDLVTTTPGAPYPSRDITHTYRNSGSYQLTLSVSYGATFRTAGGPVQPVDG
jgi:PKD repeat protein